MSASQNASAAAATASAAAANNPRRAALAALASATAPFSPLAGTPVATGPQLRGETSPFTTNQDEVGRGEFASELPLVDLVVIPGVGNRVPREAVRVVAPAPPASFSPAGELVASLPPGPGGMADMTTCRRWSREQP